MSLPWQRRSRPSAAPSVRINGTVTGIVGFSVEVRGLTASVGSVCRIDVGRAAAPVLAEVVGFRNARPCVMPYRTLAGIAAGPEGLDRRRPPDRSRGRAPARARAQRTRRTHRRGPAAPDICRERVLQFAAAAGAATAAASPSRSATGVRAIDALVTVARGQRLGIFAGSGVGKCVLLGMLARNADADVIVCALIGERGREVREFLERDLGPEGSRAAWWWWSTSATSRAVLRVKGAETAMTIAESLPRHRAATSCC